MKLLRWVFGAFPANVPGTVSTGGEDLLMPPFGILTISFFARRSHKRLSDSNAPGAALLCC